MIPLPAPALSGSGHEGQASAFLSKSSPVFIFSLTIYPFFVKFSDLILLFNGIFFDPPRKISKHLLPADLLQKLVAKTRVQFHVHMLKA